MTEDERDDAEAGDAAGAEQGAEAVPEPGPEPEASPAARDGDDEDVDAVFAALWKRVEEAWEDDKPHQAILQHALTHQMLPQLAGRYRALKDDPDKGARAQKKIDGIVAAATQMLFATKTPPRTKTPWQWTAAAAIMFGIVIAWLAYAILGR